MSVPSGYLPQWLFTPLSILVLVAGSSFAVCLVPSPNSSNHICFEDSNTNNNTDPNIINHRVDSNLDNDSDEEDENVFDRSSHRNESLLSSETRRRVNHPANSRYNPPSPTLSTPKSSSSLSRKPVKQTQYFMSGPNGQSKRRKDGSMFIPVAAYSITKRKPKRRKPQFTASRPNYSDRPTRHKMSASTLSVRQKQRPNVVYKDEEDANGEDGDEQTTPTDENDDESDDDYEMRKESAVYGYIHKPEVIEFRGQYYYGQNGQEGQDQEGQANQYSHHHHHKAVAPAVEYDNHEAMTPIVHERHRVSYLPPMDSHYEEPSTTSILLSKLKKVALFKGITAKGLLLASLPLMLTPVLSYFLTPVVIPITATVAAGRRRRKRHANASDTAWFVASGNNSHRYSNFKQSNTFASHPLGNDIPEKKLNEAKILLQYLNKVKPDERLATSAVASFLECDGLFLPSDRCLEQLSCEFSDMQNANAVQLERAVTSIIIAHLLNNEFISKKFKKRLKRAAVYGREHSGQCKHKYPCQRVLLNQINQATAAAGRRRTRTGSKRPSKQTNK